MFVSIAVGGRHCCVREVIEYPCWDMRVTLLGCTEYMKTLGFAGVKEFLQDRADVLKGDNSV